MQTLRRTFTPGPLVAMTMALAAALLAGCASLLGPRTVTLTQAELERLLQRNFPVDRTLLDVFDVTVNAPRVQLVPERNRVAAVVELRARDKIFASTWQGQLSFDAALRWEPRDHTVRLAQVRVQDLLLNQPGSVSPHISRSTVERIGAALAERVLEDSTIYRLPADKVQQMQQMGVRPDAVTVTPRGVEITFKKLQP